MKILAVLILAAGAWAQVADSANKGYKTKEGRDKVAAGLDDPHRDGRQKPLELIAAMNIKAGMTVADIGTGTGYMLPFPGPRCRPFGQGVRRRYSIRFSGAREGQERAECGAGSWHHDGS